MAGAIMGGFVTLDIWVLAAYQFFAWYAEEQALEKSERTLPDDLTWDDVQAELARPPRG